MITSNSTSALVWTSVWLLVCFGVCLTETDNDNMVSGRVYETEDAVVIEAATLRAPRRTQPEDSDSNNEVLFHHRQKRQFGGWPAVLPIGPCFTSKGLFGHCTSFRRCYPYFKLPELSNWDTWILGMYDTCSYFTTTGRQKFGVCCSNPEPPARPPQSPPPPPTVVEPEPQEPAPEASATSTMKPVQAPHNPGNPVPVNWPPPLPTHSPDNTIPPLPTHPPSPGWPGLPPATQPPLAQPPIAPTAPPPPPPKPPVTQAPPSWPPAMITHPPPAKPPAGQPIPVWPPPFITHPPPRPPTSPAKPPAKPPAMITYPPPKPPASWPPAIITHPPPRPPTAPVWPPAMITNPPPRPPATPAPPVWPPAMITHPPPRPTRPPADVTLAPVTTAPDTGGAFLGDGSCGAKNGYQDQERIVGGQNADLGEWPWIAALFNGPRQFCGGSLIDSIHILTAAHCVAHMSSWDVARLTVKLGDHNIKTNSETKHVEKKVAKVVRHRGFDSRTLYNDVAVLTMDSPVTFTKQIKPICLPTGSALYNGQTATVIGWGSLRESGPQPAILQEVNIPIWTNAECKAKYGNAAPGGIVEHFLCAGQAGRDSCSGDSGGPLTVNNGRWTQVGVVSWGIGCGKGQYPGVYTRVTYFMPWITKNLK